MIVQRFFDPRLAQTSYLLGCGRRGVAAVIDPHRDIDLYVRAAASEGLVITLVTETHIHADFVSGSRALARRTGAQLALSGEGGPDWQYAFASADGARLLHEGDRLEVGNVLLEVLHTPGHTPEHIAFLVTDRAAADSPIAAVTGDFVFVGDVGRPDLLERAAGTRGSMEPAARALRSSLERFRAQPDWLQLWPGHGAGSACGKGLSSVPHSTVGYERRFNWAFAIDDADEFVQQVLAGQPDPPRYFAEMKRLNRDGPPLDFAPPPRRRSASELAACLADGELVVDLRPAAAWAAGHHAGTLSLPHSRSFTTYAGTVLPFDRDLHLIAPEPAEAAALEAARDLAMIGLDRVAGWFSAGECGLTPAGLQRDGLARLDSIPSAELAERLRLGSVTLIDVRGTSEWEEERIAGALHVPLGALSERAAELPRHRPLVLQCRSGARSAIAASLLAHAGFEAVLNLSGGLLAWREAGLPTLGAAEPRPTRTSTGAVHESA